MVINRSQVKGNVDLQVNVIEESPHDISDLIQSVHLLIIGKEHVSVDLVNEHFVSNVFVQIRSHLDDVSQSNASGLVFLLLSVNHINH